MRSVRLWLLLALLVPLGACAHGVRDQINPASAAATDGGTAAPGGYLLDTGDVLRIVVYGDAQLSQTYRIDDAGAVAMPLVGPVAVRGLTTKAAATRIASALANGFMRNPNVAVEVSEYRPFFIQGGVVNSGQYPYVYGMTVRAAVSTAGGFAELADRNRALIYRRSGDRTVAGAVGPDFVVAPGDTVVIPER